MSTVRYQTVGAIDGTHIEINSPTGHSKIYYFNKEQRYSISTQAVVGGYLKFLDIEQTIPAVSGMLVF